MAIKNSFNLSSIHDPVSTNAQIKKRRSLAPVFLNWKALLDEVTTCRSKENYRKSVKAVFTAIIFQLLFPICCLGICICK